MIRTSLLGWSEEHVFRIHVGSAHRLLFVSFQGHFPCEFTPATLRKKSTRIALVLNRAIYFDKGAGLSPEKNYACGQLCRLRFFFSFFFTR